MTQQDRDITQLRATEVRGLIDMVGDNPVLVPQLTQLAEELEGELKKSRGEVLFAEVLPRVALFLKGSAVQGQRAIRPALAGEALVQYEKMFIQQALHEERSVARSEGRHRRRRGTPKPELWFTGTPRGSFGLEFTPKEVPDGGLTVIHSKALLKVADFLGEVSDPTNDLRVLPELSANVIGPMRRFFTVLSDNDAELRIAASDGRSKVVSREQVRATAERLGKEFAEVELSVTGTFRGLTHESYVFDLVTDAGVLISGSISDEATEEDLDRIDALTNKRCLATLVQTTIRFAGGKVSRDNFTLLDAVSVDEE